MSAVDAGAGAAAAAAEFEEHTPNLRVFRNYAGYARE
jgi:hypothetical protein